jgi:hypothetical protein
LKTATRARVEKRQTKGWKALDSLALVEHHAMVGFVMMQCSLVAVRAYRVMCTAARPHGALIASLTGGTTSRLSSRNSTIRMCRVDHGWDVMSGLVSEHQSTKDLTERQVPYLTRTIVLSEYDLIEQIDAVTPLSSHNNYSN